MTAWRPLWSCTEVSHRVYVCYLQFKIWLGLYQLQNNWRLMRLPRATRILKRVFKKCDGIDFDLEKPRINLFSSVYVSMYFCSHTGLLPNLVNKLFCFLCILWQYGLWRFQTGGTKLESFCLRINKLKGNYWILRIGLMGRCQKADII